MSLCKARDWLLALPANTKQGCKVLPETNKTQAFSASISDGEEKGFIILTPGRRGLDDKGIVILMLDEKMVASVGRNLVPLL
jgi:hypothetical protein